MEHFQLLSNVHLGVERGSTLPYFDFPVTAPNLTLLGDIGWTRDERLFEWLELQLSRFERVFFVIGNHGPRLLTLDENLTRLEIFAARFSPITRGFNDEFILHRRRYDLSPTLSILGYTLWSALNPDYLGFLTRSLTDFKHIESPPHLTLLPTKPTSTGSHPPSMTPAPPSLRDASLCSLTMDRH